jgi:peroxiredoxin
VAESPQTESGRRLADRLFHVVLTIVFVAMAVEIVLLVRQNRELEATVSELAARLESLAAPPALAVGETVSPLELRSLDGSPTEIAYDDGVDTVLLVFSPDCPACEANIDRWKRLAEANDPTCNRMYWVSTADAERTRPFTERHALPPPVLIGTGEALAAYKVTHVPTTVVVGPGGVVESVWVGALSDDAEADIRGRCNA